MNTEHHTYWRLDCLVTPRNLGEALYHLNFRNRDFGKLPPHVQDSYCLDATKLIQHFGGKQTGT